MVATTAGMAPLTMPSVSGLIAVSLAASLHSATKLAVPATLGVPMIVPSVVSVSPDGRDPPTTDPN